MATVLRACTYGCPAYQDSNGQVHSDNGGQCPNNNNGTHNLQPVAQQDDSLSLGARLSQLVILITFTAVVCLYWWDVSENGDNFQSVIEKHDNVYYFVSYFWILPYGSFIFWFILRFPMLCPCCKGTTFCDPNSKSYKCCQVVSQCVVCMLCGCCHPKSKNQDLKYQKALLDRRLIFETATGFIGAFYIGHYSLRSVSFAIYIIFYCVAEWIAWLIEQYLASVNCCSCDRCQEINDEFDWRMGVTENTPLKLADLGDIQTQ